MDLSSDYEDLAAAIINNSYDAIVCYDPVKNPGGEVIDFKFTYMNDSAVNLLGRTREYYIGGNLLDLFPDAKNDGMFLAFKKTYDSGKPDEAVYFYEDENYKGWYRDTVVKYNDNIIVYFRDITDRKLQEIRLQEMSEQLKSYLAEKELMIQEIHHRVKNNLQIISSILNMQAGSITDSYALDALNISRQRISTIASIHNSLYRQSNGIQVSVTAYVGDIITSISKLYDRSGKKIKIHRDIDEFETSMKYSVNIALVLNELITNSYKHAFSDRTSGNIYVGIKKKPDIIEIALSDDGTGIPGNIDPDTTNSIGLMLVKALVDQMNGDINLSSGNGTTFSITLPLNISSPHSEADLSSSEHH